MSNTEYRAQTEQALQILNAAEEAEGHIDYHDLGQVRDTLISLFGALSAQDNE